MHLDCRNRDGCQRVGDGYGIVGVCTWVDYYGIGLPVVARLLDAVYNRSFTVGLEIIQTMPVGLRFTLEVVIETFYVSLYPL